MHIICAGPFVPLPQGLKILRAGPGERRPPGEECRVPATPGTQVPCPAAAANSLDGEIPPPVTCLGHVSLLRTTMGAWPGAVSEGWVQIQRKGVCTQPLAREPAPRQAHPLAALWRPSETLRPPGQSEERGTSACPDWEGWG